MNQVIKEKLTPPPLRGRLDADEQAAAGGGLSCESRGGSKAQR